MLTQRSTGILLHITSLPSHGGIGDLGPAAHEFAEFLGAAKQSLWQVLPLAPAGIGNSPYSATSAFAGNVLFISLERLAERGLISKAKVAAMHDSVGNVDYPRVTAEKMPLLNEAARNFIRDAAGEDRTRYERFKWDNGWWLEDFALYDVLRHRYQEVSWNRWPREFAHREPEALKRLHEESAEEIEIVRFLQFAFMEQWRALRAHCKKLGIHIIGDIAIFVSYDSSDVWTHPSLFRLSEELDPEVVAGVPPDAFSDTGQRWGNPLYRWGVLRERGYDWWIQRVKFALLYCDIIRLDHFRGFHQCWEIPASEPTAVHGRWVDGPQDDLFLAMRDSLGDLPFIAEDLGFITPGVHEMRDRLQMPGMRVLQFGFGDPGAHIYLPHRYPENSVVYTGTHDNDTTVGWWEKSDDYVRSHARAYLGEPGDGIAWAMIRAAEDSPARLCVVPLQDVLGLGSEARMNLPSSNNDGNWAWRVSRGALTPQVAEKLALLAESSDRLPVRPSSDVEAAEYFVV